MGRSRIVIKFDIPNERSFSRFWNDLASVPDDMRPAFEIMAKEFYLNNEKTFDEEGPGWKPLAASTLKEKAQEGFGGEPILQRTHRLKDSLTQRDADGSILRMTKDTLEIGTSVPYAIYHQTGNLKATTYPVGTHPPKRSPIVVRGSLRAQWTRTITDYLRTEAEKAMYTGG